MNEIIQIIGTILTLGVAVISAIVAVVVARTQRRARQDVTPADNNESTRIANDLILRLLDRANQEIARYEGIIDTLTAEANTYRKTAELVSVFEGERDRAVRERDRLRVAIKFLEAKARVVGHITYAEIVAWARNALDPEIDPSVFEVTIEDVLPDGFGDTITTA